MGGYPWIVIHRYLVTEGLVMGVHPRTFQDSLGILGVHGYSVTGVGHGCTSSDSLG